MRRFLTALGLVTLLAAPALAGSSVRYALIVGNNHGRTPPGVILSDLRHAEEEARLLRNRLIQLGNFDESGDRVVLLLGKSRGDILAAAKRMAERHRRDREMLGDVPTLFAFFYTGHGLEGKLLTAGDPLTAADLSAVFKDMDATFTVGVFDACFSGNLDLDSLKLKGLRTTPGFNAFEELPQEVLNSKGTMWFTSSRPDQVSYEDDHLGGVFTHFFIEALEHAEPDRFGVTLDEIWEYARSRTQKYTSRAGRPQTPQKMIRNLTSTGPLYFSFPTSRNAALIFDAPVEGSFLVRYESGQLTELIDKESGGEKHVAMYPGEVLIERLSAKGRERQYITLASGSTVRVRDRVGWTDAEGLGSRESALVAKGGRLEGLVLTERVWNWSGLLELDYRTAFGPDYSAVTMHNGGVGFRVDYGFLYLRLSLWYGAASADYQAWGYDLDRADLRLEAGPAFNLGDFRLSVAVEGSLFSREVSYRDGAKRPRGGFGAGVTASLLYPVVRGPLGVFVGLRVGLCAERASPVTPMDAAPDWSLVPWAGIGLSMAVF
jgi:hypothetical protein